MIAWSLPAPSRTEDLAAALAACLQPGDVVLLRGDLGAGKTTLVQGIARALGITESVRSPTYTVAHRYEHDDGRRLSHLDLYRQAGALGAAAWGDVEEYFDADWTCIEWPDAAAVWLTGRRCWQVSLELHGAERRLATIAAPDAGATGQFLSRACDALARGEVR